MRVYECPKVFV
jgi:hypothetical protein